MKKILNYAMCAVFAAACLLVPTACGGVKYAIPKYEDGKSMIIGSWVPYFGDGSQERYDEIAAAGFTTLFNIGEQVNYTNPSHPTYVKKVLDRAQAAGLNAVLFDDAMSGKRVPTLDTRYTDLYMDHPALLGNNIYDEPSARQFEDLGAQVETYKELFSGKLAYLNLFPDVGAGTLQAANFETYVTEFMETVKPDLLSYDNYVLYDDGSVKESFFIDMSKVRYIAAQFGVPAFNFLLAVGHKAGPFKYRQPDEVDFRWQIACDLAYGYSGFSYYCYWERKDPNYEECIISKKGQKTELYYAAQQVNYEILAWDHVYLDFNWEGTALVKNAKNLFSPLFAGVNLKDPVTLIGGIGGVSAQYDALFGMFKDGRGNRGFMVTNATNTLDRLENTVTVTFDKEYKGVMVYGKDVLADGEPEIFALNKSGEFTMTLDPGEGRFLIPLKKK